MCSVHAPDVAWCRSFSNAQIRREPDWYSHFREVDMPMLVFSASTWKRLQGVGKSPNTICLPQSCFPSHMQTNYIVNCVYRNDASKKNKDDWNEECSTMNTFVWTTMLLFLGLGACSLLFCHLHDSSVWTLHSLLYVCTTCILHASYLYS